MKTILFVGTILAGSVWAEPRPSAIQEVVESGITALQKSGPIFASKSGCISCHHQGLPAQVTGMAKARGYRYDAGIQAKEIESILKMIVPAKEALLEGSQVVPQLPATGSHILFALNAHGYPMDSTTTAIVNGILKQQQSDGSWPGWSPRPPISAGDIRETALAVRGLTLYGPKGRRKEIDARIAEAREWLLSVKPTSPEEAIVYLDGLYWSKAPKPAIQAAAKKVMKLQRPDGGWAQLNTRDSDAYATGEALVVLHRAGAITTSDAAYERGFAYLMRTREEDGTWHVKTRAYPFQPLIDSGYPHGRDQWISAAGTSYALMALMLADPVK